MAALHHYILVVIDFMDRMDGMKKLLAIAMFMLWFAGRAWGQLIINPADTDSLEGWWYADGIDQMDATSVATWPDSSGNARNFTQGTSSDRPTFLLSQSPTTLPGVIFDGTSDIMDAGVASTWRFLHNGESVTVGIVLEVSAPVGSGVHVLLDNSNALTGTYGFIASLTSTPANGAAFTCENNSSINYDVVSATNAISTSAPTILLFSFQDGIADSGAIFYANDTTAGYDDTQGLAWLDVDALNVLALGSRNNGVSTYCFSGTIYEVAIWSKAFSREQRTGIHNYFYDKWIGPLPGGAGDDALRVRRRGLARAVAQRMN